MAVFLWLGLLAAIVGNARDTNQDGQGLETSLHMPWEVQPLKNRAHSSFLHQVTLDVGVVLEAFALIDKGAWAGRGRPGAGSDSA